MRAEKRIGRLLSRPKDYTFTEAKALLSSLGFEQYNKGKTSGSRVRFYRKSDMKAIDLHKPHPGDIMKTYMVDELIRFLKESGDIDE